jgi:erythromycin esterase-like protein
MRLPFTLRWALTSCLFAYSYTYSNAQDSFNLDFEHEAEQGQPRAWFIEGEDQFVAGLTENTAHSRSRSLEVTVNGGQAITFLTLRGDRVSNKTVRISGFIKSTTSEGLQMMLGFKDPSLTKPVIFPIEYDSVGQWGKVSAEKSFESYTSDRLLIAIIIAGHGHVFIDDFKLTIDGVEIRDDLPDFPEPSHSTLNSLNKESIPFTPGERLSGDALLKMVGDARIVALGENSHGSATIFIVKLALIQVLIEKGGFTIFALECPQQEAKRVNEYVQGGTATKDEILTSLVYPAWKTQEMLDIIEWIRQYNSTKGAAIQFRGFDMMDKNGIDRDRVMAELIKEWIENSPKERIILSGDNTHITKSTGKMGSYLRHWYGKSYVPVGFTFGGGTYAAYGPNNPYTVHPPYPGTSEYLFSKMTPRNFMLDMRRPKVYEVFSKPFGFRSIGSRPQETTQFANTDLPAHFDMIVFLEKSAHTRPLSE